MYSTCSRPGLAGANTSGRGTRPDHRICTSCCCNSEAQRSSRKWRASQLAVFCLPPCVGLGGGGGWFGFRLAMEVVECLPAPPSPTHTGWVGGRHGSIWRDGFVVNTPPPPPFLPPAVLLIPAGHLCTLFFQSCRPASASLPTLCLLTPSPPLCRVQLPSPPITLPCRKTGKEPAGKAQGLFAPECGVR